MLFNELDTMYGGLEIDDVCLMFTTSEFNKKFLKELPLGETL